MPSGIARAGLTTLACAALLTCAPATALTDGPATARPPSTPLKAPATAALWTTASGLTPAGERLRQRLADAWTDGLDPAVYAVDTTGADRPAVEAAISRAALDLARDLHRPSAGMALDASPDLWPAAPAPETLLPALAAPAGDEAVDRALGMNLLYSGLRTALLAEANRRADADLIRRIRLNMERARALPADLGRRYVWVDVPTQTLLAADKDGSPLSMRVIIGKPQQQTPVMTGLIRAAVLNPYWNVPPDLVRQSIARKAMAGGAAFVAGQRLELLDGWTAGARRLTPESVDWLAVAAGAPLRVRQKPGPQNMLGRIKFASPNPLGVYLHDTPRRDLFRADLRTFSSGCVRLENAEALARWLFGAAPAPTAEAEARIDLPAPTPLYITYFTLLPKVGGGLIERPDPYGRDRPDAPQFVSSAAMS